ncbi:MAG: hypothetical protein WBJ83_05440, partial [Thermacetogeniaceae bacterium]
YNVVHKRSSPFGWFVLVHSILPKVMISCLFLLVFSYKNFTLCEPKRCQACFFALLTDHRAITAITGQVG